MQRYLVKIIEEQVSVGFTGKINILNIDTKQLLGSIILSDGDIIHATFKKSKGLKAIASTIIDELSGPSLKYIVEPEIVSVKERTIELNFVELKEKLSQIVGAYKELEKQRPADDLKLLINPDVIYNENQLTAEEFDLLCTISDSNLVKDIYGSSELLDFEITKSLISLRKKNGIKVIGKK